MATSKRDRIFAIFGIIVVVVSAAALSVAVIIQQFTTNNTAASNVTPKDSQIAACTDNATEKTLSIPARYTADNVSDLQSTDITEGSGAAAKAGDCIVAKYYGTLAKDGTLFDENYTKSSGFAFKLGQGQVIKGWDQGVVGMKPGGERRLVIPSSLGYGDQPAGSIPASSDLVFYVTLLRVK